MFQPGDRIIYGSTGVCTVEAVGPQDHLPGSAPGTLYYTLTPLGTSGRVFVPVDAPVYMRPLVTREEAERLLATVPQICAEAYHQRNLQQLRTHYQELLQSHDCGKLLELVMSVHTKELEAKKAGRRLGQIDQRFQKRAEELLYAELSVVLDIPMEAVPAYIAAKAEGK